MAANGEMPGSIVATWVVKRSERVGMTVILLASTVLGVAACTTVIVLSNKPPADRATEPIGWVIGALLSAGMLVLIAMVPRALVVHQDGLTVVRNVGPRFYPKSRILGVERSRPERPGSYRILGIRGRVLAVPHPRLMGVPPQEAEKLLRRELGSADGGPWLAPEFEKAADPGARRWGPHPLWIGQLVLWASITVAAAFGAALWRRWWPDFLDSGLPQWAFAPVYLGLNVVPIWWLLIVSDMLLRKGWMSVELDEGGLALRGPRGRRFIPAAAILGVSRQPWCCEVVYSVGAGRRRAALFERRLRCRRGEVVAALLARFGELLPPHIPSKGSPE
jgi:hypothetical protein